MYELRKADNELIAQWDELVFFLPGGTLFHTLEWLDFLGKNQGLDIQHIGIFLNEKIVGILPLCINHLFFMNVAGSPYIVEDTYYMGPAIEAAHIPELLPAIDRYMKDKKIHYLRMMSNQHLGMESTIDGYDFIDKHTHILDITESYEKLWQGLEDRCRDHIRRAKKSGIVVQIETNRDYIDSYYSLIEHVYHSQEMPCPNRKNFYRDMWDRFGGENALFLSARYKGELIAGVIIIVDRTCAYYLNGASKHDFRSLAPNNLLLWEACRITKERGIEKFDFVGSDIPRLTEFKKSFGGELITHSLVEKAGSQWVRFLREKYPVYRKAIGNIREKFKWGKD